MSAGISRIAVTANERCFDVELLCTAGVTAPVLLPDAGRFDVLKLGARADSGGLELVGKCRAYRES